MNVITLEGDRYMSVLPPSDVIRALKADLYDRGYDQWNRCVVKDIVPFRVGEQDERTSGFVKGSVTFILDEHTTRPPHINAVRNAVYLDDEGFGFSEDFFYRPCLVPLDAKGRKVLDQPLNPDWMETEGGSAYINRSLVDLDVLKLSNGMYSYSRLDQNDSFSIRNTCPDQIPLKWVWMSGYMVCVNFEVAVRKSFITSCRYMH